MGTPETEATDGEEGKAEGLMPKPPSESAVENAVTVKPADANSLGIVHGGRALYLMDEAAGICAARHAGRRTVTAAVDDVRFHRRIEMGSAMVVRARVVWVGNSSMVIETHLLSERLPRGEREPAVSATFTYVGLDEQGRPASVPPLLPETDDERMRERRTAERRAARLEMPGV